MWTFELDVSDSMGNWGRWSPRSRSKDQQGMYYLLRGNVNLGEKLIYLINNAAILVIHLDKTKAKSSLLT